MTVVEQPAPATDPAGRIADAVRAARRESTGPSAASTAILAVDTADVAHFLHARFERSEGLELLGIGVPASPGAASGRVVLSADDAIAAAERGEAVILVRRETTPDDVLGMQAARGILTARGGIASHAAVVARGWGIPAVVGLEALHIDAGGFELEGRRIATGDLVSIDGHSGELFAGGTEVSVAAAPPELEVLLGWADQVRAGRFAIRANADNATDAAHSRSLGAEGIGLCRTEHMFLADDRLPLVRRLILSDDPAEDEAALAALEVAQQDDFEALLAAMDGLPVTVRLLDPPLHEFLPDLETLVVADARGELDDEQRAVLNAVRRLHEVNPMIGTRGVRLGVVKPGLYPMQVRAICRAVTSLLAAGRSPIVEVMIPLVVSARELRVSRQWVLDAEASVDGTGAGRDAISVGTMIETPRAAIVAGALAEVADFFSFGTNDLTQLTFAFSRDDVEAKLLPRYLEASLLDGNPFEVLDEAGVGFLVRHAVEQARAVNPTMKIGACGEHAGDPGSARFLVASGLDYVSCSPYRLPVVRLAVAQALLELGLADGTDVSTAVDERPALVEPVSAASRVAGVVDVPADAPFRLLHALKIKGFAPVATLAEMAATPEEAVAAELERLREAELARFLEARGFWQLTPAGRDHHASLLPGAPPESLDLARHAYEGFLSHNLAFKDLCSAWQMRADEINDHTDAEYDAARIAELLAHDEASQPVLEALAAAIDRLGTYRARLTAAAERTAAGELDLFTGVLKGSYHDVWMELHEDLICILGVDRHAEGSF
jgi:phosphoenolpyruvate-protein kinase (PTS system EI component)